MEWQNLRFHHTIEMKETRKPGTGREQVSCPRFSARCLVLGGVFACASALAQAPDTVLFNGRIVTLDARSSVHQALAIRDGRIVALGTNAQIKKLVGRESRGQDSIVDLKGRTVIPGLIDSHMHAIRAALSFSTHVYPGERVVRVRGERARVAGGREACRSCRAIEGLLQGAGGRDRGDRGGDDGGGWEGGVCGQVVIPCERGGEARKALRAIGVNAE